MEKNERQTEMNLPSSARQRQLEQLRQNTGNGWERMTVAFACAAQDRDYQVTFVRMPFTARASNAKRPIRPRGASRGPAGRPANTSRVAADLIDITFACAWCGASNEWTLCDRCNAMICGAKTVGTGHDNGHFTCRPSCGRAFRLVPLVEVPVAKSGSSAGKAIGHAAMKLLAGR